MQYLAYRAPINDRLFFRHNSFSIICPCENTKYVFIKVQVLRYFVTTFFILSKFKVCYDFFYLVQVPYIHIYFVYFYTFLTHNVFPYVLFKFRTYLYSRHKFSYGIIYIYWGSVLFFCKWNLTFKGFMFCIFLLSTLCLFV